jgi:hypothetical protein
MLLLLAEVEVGDVVLSIVELNDVEVVVDDLMPKILLLLLLMMMDLKPPPMMPLVAAVVVDDDDDDDDDDVLESSSSMLREDDDKDGKDVDNDGLRMNELLKPTATTEKIVTVNAIFVVAVVVRPIILSRLLTPNVFLVARKRLPRVVSAMVELSLLR